MLKIVIKMSKKRQNWVVQSSRLTIIHPVYFLKGRYRYSKAIGCKYCETCSDNTETEGRLSNDKYKTACKCESKKK